ncbi:ornithine cyclodeaminase family protein [Embleya sp. NPDC005575]|uniref:ornithine cyclodeaminase family protein n=1 Tax=Embleya sp. NPDC005575 TaxID=3156892 RepID=UPI0033B0EEAC
MSGPGTESEPRIFDADPIRRAIGFEDLIEPVARALADFGTGLGEAPISVFAPAGDEGDVHVKSAWLPGRSIFTVKVGTWFTARARNGRSAADGYVVVHDATTGEPIALLRDEHHLTDVRTAAAGALATRLLARADATVLAVLGTGTQAYLQSLAAGAVRPIDTVLVRGRNPASARRLQNALAAARPNWAVSVVADAERAVRAADVIVTATAGREPVVAGPWLRPGQHVTAIGADDPGKAELDPDCFRRADLVVVDSRIEAGRFAGDLRAALDAGAITAAEVETELGDLVLGSRPGRPAREDITIAKLIGLGAQDLAAAETALHRLRAAPTPHRPTPASALDLTDAADPVRRR